MGGVRETNNAIKQFCAVQSVRTHTICLSINPSPIVNANCPVEPGNSHFFCMAIYFHMDGKGDRCVHASGIEREREREQEGGGARGVSGGQFSYICNFMRGGGEEREERTLCDEGAVSKLILTAA